MENLNSFQVKENEMFFNSTYHRNMDEGRLIETDYMYVYNPDKIKKLEMYQSLDSMVFDNLYENLLGFVNTLILVKRIGIYYRSKTTHYRNLINRIYPSNKNLFRLLKIKYNLEFDYYNFSKLNSELDIKRDCFEIMKIIEKNPNVKIRYFNGCEQTKYYPYKQFFYEIKNLWNEINRNKNELVIDIDNKINLSNSLKTFIDVKKTIKLSWGQLFLAAVTIYLLIYPDMVNKIKNNIDYIVNLIRSYIAILK